MSTTEKKKKKKQSSTLKFPSQSKQTSTSVSSI